MFETEHIEKITQSVLRELEARGVGVERQQTTAAKPSHMLSGVVTQSVLEESQPEASVVLAADAIITPSGHEYLRRNNVQVSRSTDTTTQENFLGLVLCSAGSATVLSAAKSAGWEVQKMKDDNAIVEIVSDTSRTVCCVKHPSLVACLLNRNENIRAAVGTANLDLTPLKEVMNPNVICVNAGGWSFTAFLRMLKTLNGSTT